MFITQPIRTGFDQNLLQSRPLGANSLERSQSGLAQAGQTTANMMRKQYQPGSERTAGGTLMSAAGGAIAGAEFAGTAVGSQVLGTVGTGLLGGTMEATAAGSMAGPAGMAIGALIGIGAYLLG